MDANSAMTATTGDWALPIFLKRENKYTVGWSMFGFAAGIYMLANHLHMIPPIFLPMTWVDNAVPFMPNSVWIYISEYAFFTAIYMCFRDYVNANRYIYAFLTLQITSCMIFWLWPTTYPRDQFPLTDDVNALTYFAFNTLRNADSPANCCPSLHVSSVFLSSFIYLKEQRGKFPFFFVWAALIAASTLTTKQHYLVDVLTGFLMAVIHYWIFDRLVSYRPLASGAQAKR
jgi:membrane-associated phospholipid phosphatase